VKQAVQVDPYFEAALIDLDNEINLEAEGPAEEDEGGSWDVQVLRSITSDSAAFDEERVGVLHRKYGRLVDNSIMRSYVNLIRNAENFVYVENQYFMGSAFSWFRERSTLTNHIIPKELAIKIANKIKAGEPFKAYVTIPMYPEGDPTSKPSQEILYWQSCTMESMYKIIAKAIEDAGAGTHPQDYLNFFCLGKRESPEDVPDDLEQPCPDSLPGKVRASLRHPIYVHSKMLIVDDDFIVVGSANINQRSLGGNRDTEICIGAFQPGHTTTTSDGQPRGAVHTFRTAVWSAHLGGYDPVYEDPSSDECLAKVREVAADFWTSYTDPEPSHSDVHLLPYPVIVAETGDISPLEEPWDCFPDTTAKVMGAKSSLLPAKLTT